MKHRPIVLTRLAGIALALAASVASAQNTVNGPYYATPSWDQTMPASTRFLVLANFNGQAVLDRETGLVWQRAVSDAQFDSVAVFLCHRSQVGGRYGWRLPTVMEATSLFDPSVLTIPSLPVGHPFTGFDVTQPYLWTSTRELSYLPQRSPARTYIRNATSDGGQSRIEVLQLEDASGAKSQFL